MLENTKTRKPKQFDIRAYYSGLTQQLLARDQLSQNMLSHGTLLGDQTEKITRDFIRQILPPTLGVETGQITAPNGVISPQSDVVIFSNVFGAVLGASEDGTHLIHQDAVKCVIEVKRSATAEQITSINDYFLKLCAAFSEGERGEPWFPYSIVFHSPQKTLDAIQKELNAIPIANLKVKGVLVLNATHSADELVNHYEDIRPEEPEEKVKGGPVRDMINNCSAPNSAFFLFKDSATGFIRMWENEPPLLTFVIRLHENLKSFSGKSHFCWDSFLPHE